LAKLGDPRLGVGLRDDGLPDIAWMEIPEGSFKIGTRFEDVPSLENRLDKPEWYSHEQETPQRKMALSAYHISRYPITNAQFAAFADAGGYREDHYWTRAAREEVWCEGEIKAWNDDEPREGPYNFGEPFSLPNHPVVGVTWYEAVAFCLWLTEALQGQGELREDQEISLPTELQWEKAARSADGRCYPWGEDSDPNRANYDDTGIGTTSVVGCFPDGISPYGVEDLGGNVWEWCRTKWKENYEEGRNNNDLEGSVRRVLRGGSFADTDYYIRCAFRPGSTPLYRNRNRGFRVVVSRA
jgi:formylglycine-generating enzyme required for sulfatase activity